MRSRIYHICTPASWQSQLGETAYSDPSLESEGFIHCSMKEQLDATLGRYFRDIPELLILEILPSAVAQNLRMEPASHSQERFPHVYGTVPKSAILKVHRFDWKTPARELVEEYP